MKKIFFVLLLLIVHWVNGQIAENLQGTYMVLPTSDQPYNQFNTLIVDHQTISFQIDGTTLYSYETTPSSDETSITLKCILSEGREPDAEIQKFRFTINHFDSGEYIAVSITYKSINKTINIKRL